MSFSLILAIHEDVPSTPLSTYLKDMIPLKKQTSHDPQNVCGVCVCSLIMMVCMCVLTDNDGVYVCAH